MHSKNLTSREFAPRMGTDATYSRSTRNTKGTRRISLKLMSLRLFQ